MLAQNVPDITVTFFVTVNGACILYVYTLEVGGGGVKQF